MDTSKPDIMAQLTAEIFTVTLQLQLKSPALYLLLGETPLYQSPAIKEILITDYRQYLETLKAQLR